MMRIGVACMVGAAGLAALVIVPEPVEAQGVRNRIERQAKNCPPGWSSDKDFCVPNSGNSPAVYHGPRNGTCADGYKSWGNYWCVEDKSARRGSGSAAAGSAPTAASGPPTSAGLLLTKGNPRQLCPSGYRTSGDLKHCNTEFANAPLARARPAGGCAADELEEFGVWCTARQTGLTAKQIETVTMQDFNIIYTFTRERPVPERSQPTTPLMLALGGAAPAASSGASDAVQTAGATTADAASKPACRQSKKGQAARALGGLMGRKGATVEAAGAALDCVD